MMRMDDLHVAAEESSGKDDDANDAVDSDDDHGNVDTDVLWWLPILLPLLLLMAILVGDGDLNNESLLS